MRKLSVWLLIIALIAGCLTGCGKEEPTPPVQSDPAGGEAKDPANESGAGQNEEVNELVVDGYWVAESWTDPDADGPETLDPELWALDLLIRHDGTARFRDIHSEICLVADDHLELTWESTTEGELLFYSPVQVMPVLRGTLEEGVLSIDYLGGILTMKQTPEPTAIGQIYSPAELEGTWLMVSGVTEGWEWEAMPGNLSSLVFYVTSFDGPLCMAAHREDRDYYGDMADSAHNMQVEVLSKPLYEGCENGDWSVRIGPASPVDENGYPLETEYYATLLGHNTLLVQQYYTLDGYPAVSYQTYARFPDRISWQSPDSMELDMSNWTCAEYISLSGESMAIPEELKDMRICLLENNACWIQYSDGNTLDGTWMLETGGVILLRSDDEAEDSFWFAGAVSGYSAEFDFGFATAYEMSLYYNGGILKMVLEAYG